MKVFAGYVLIVIHILLSLFIKIMQNRHFDSGIVGNNQL